MNEQDKLNDFRNIISSFIDENCIVKVSSASQWGGVPETEIIFDESDGGKILEKNIKELFEEVRKM